jgi:hypothetical protein
LVTGSVTSINTSRSRLFSPGRLFSRIQRALCKACPLFRSIYTNKRIQRNGSSGINSPPVKLPATASHVTKLISHPESYTLRIGICQDMSGQCPDCPDGLRANVVTICHTAPPNSLEISWWRRGSWWRQFTCDWPRRVQAPRLCGLSRTVVLEVRRVDRGNPPSPPRVRRDKS